MQSSVCALLLISSAIMLTCIVVDYAANVFQTALQTSNIPQLDRIRDLENGVLNQTVSGANQAIMQPTNQTEPP